MKREKLISILKEDGYSSHTINSIVAGRRKPNAEKRYLYEQQYDIPFDAWADIKSYLNSTKTDSQTSNTIEEEKVS